jgi:hypothetical protein
MIRPLLLLAACLTATEALALSCVPPDPLQSFRMAHEAPETYVVLRGRLSFDQAQMPDGSEVPPGAAETRLDPIQASFEGFALGLSGFTRPVSAPVLLQPLCFGQFCGSFGPGEDWLLFAQASGSGQYTVTVDPCGQWAFDRTSQETLDALAACIRGSACGG